MPFLVTQMMMFQTRVFLGGVDAHDQYKDLRLDVDNMSYEVRIIFRVAWLSPSNLCHQVTRCPFSTGTARVERKDRVCQHWVERRRDPPEPQETKTFTVCCFPVTKRMEVHHLSSKFLLVYCDVLHFITILACSYLVTANIN